MKPGVICLCMGLSCFFLLPSMPAYAADTEMAPIPMKLPDPVYQGTPFEYESDILEPEDFRERPPFMAPKDVTNIAKGKPVTSSDTAPTLGKLPMIVDGDKNFAKNSQVELAEGKQWVQMDLEKESEIYAILLWHNYENKRVYFDFIVQVSDDPEFKSNTTTLYNNDPDNSSGLGIGKDKEYIETNKGRLIDAKGIKGRYLRFYSSGNSADDRNHYTEIEVYGRPIEN